MWRRDKSDEVNAQRELPHLLTSALNQIDEASLVSGPGDVAIFTNPEMEQLGILRDGRIQSEELRASIRVVRRTNVKHTGKIEIARGPIGEGKREITVTLIPLTENEFVLVLLRDESEAQRVHDVRRDFVANISHELKTPVGALSLLTEAVQVADTDIEQVRHFTSRMQTEVKRLTAMISDLVALSQVQGDAPLRNSTPVSVANIISEAVDATKIAAEQKGIEVAISENTDVGRIFGDEEQLHVALSNLITNAIKYSPNNTKVGIGARRKDDLIEISVTDQGPGIPEESLSRIFERFYRVDPARSRDTGGTGLGLAIVKHVCASHGGDCLVWSQEGQGSTFTLRFPAHQNGVGIPTEVVSK